MQYLALIGDVVDSKQLSKRDEFQAKLATLLRETSNRNPALASPYTITLGDEFQAVYKSADRLFADIFSIWSDVHPVQVRFGIGVGELSTAINRKQALGMDGPAFHRAREAITEPKGTDYLIRLQGESPPQGSTDDPWKLLNHLFNMTTHKVARWEKNRLHIMRDLLLEKPVSEMEADLGISNVAVYKNINAAALDEFKGLCTEVTKLLNRELKRP